MNYTLLMTEEIHGDQVLQLDKSGNEYVVGLYNKANKEYKCRHFKRIEDAREKYLELCAYMIHGYYSYSDRVEKLLTEV